jgi:hypothetical protein
MRNVHLTASRGVALLSAVAFAILAGSALADEIKTRTWTGNGADNLWTNPDNWEPSEVSGSSYNNVFPAGRDWEVVIETAPRYYSLQLPEGSGTVTFKGAGQLKDDNNAYIQVGAGREINVDGVEFRLCKNSCSENAFINGTLRLSSRSIMTYGSYSDGYHVIGGDAKVIVEGGEFGSSNSYLCLSNNATLTVRGGLVRCTRYTFCSPDAPRESITRVKLLGGILWNDCDYAYMMSFQDGAHLEFLGGRLQWGRANSLQYNCLTSEVGKYSPGSYFADCLPQFGGELVIPTCTTNGNGAMKFHYSNRDYDFGGTVYVTNNCNEAGVLDEAAGTVYFYGEDEGTLSIRGGATVCANTLKIYAKKTFTNNLDLTRLNLGIGGIRRNEEYGGPSYQYFNFLDGIEFGAWGGDVARSGAARSRLLVRPQGPVVFDTKDCFDPTTSRTINMDCIRLDDVTDFKATGGGTVAIYPGATWTGEFRTLEVSDNTTLAFCTNNLADWENPNSYISGVKAMNLKLGANAKVKINMSFGDYVDASSTVEFGEGAKIVVADLPATLTEGMFYPVYFAPAGTEADLSKIEYAEGEWPEGWYLAKRGCAVYLTDGNESVYSDPNNKWSWSGGGSDNVYTNLDNWGGKEGSNCNTTGGADIYYNGRKNTDVNIDNPSMVQRRWMFGADAGPFVFDGELFRFQYPNSFTNYWSQSINSESRFPVVVSNNLATQGFALWMAARKQGSISLMGLGGMNNALNGYVPLFVGGDIRIGGTYTSEYVRVASDVWDAYVKRATRLTIMPGGSLKVLNQSGDFHERGVSGHAAYGVTGGALAVATGGVLDIAGTELLFTCDTTHYVDGAMTVSCPLVPQRRQTFRGDGTLTLAGGVSSAAGGVRVEGNLTLVPSDWMNDVVLSVKDNVTIAPTGDWTFGGDASIDLDDRSTLTLATGGHKIKFAKPIVSKGTLAVTGNGTIEIAAEGMSLDKVEMADGATFSVAKNILALGTQVDVLTVRDDDNSITFAADVPNLKRRVDERGYTIYSVKGVKGLSILIR